ncbi:hypothetical protein [Sphaerisporangium perillae]|uniref:hypothetical protein n=1 Tax=Sphaerisporangium perillae TaxID=2935860 RepID=UPI0020109C77|nr:hypothetical protein [Sphaerisporangium perillae]
MPLNDEVKKIAESKPFYAVAGVGDYAVEKLRELPEQFHRLQSRRTEAGAVARDLPTMARKYATTVQTKAEAVAKDLPEKAKGYADTITAKATLLYDEFANRGRKVVSRVTGEAALELEDVSASAEPAIAARPATPRKSTRTTGAGTKA